MCQVLLPRLWVCVDLEMRKLQTICTIIQVRGLWIRRALNMTKLVARIKILPKEVEVNLESVAERLSMSIPVGMKLLSHVTEPIAFGLNSLIADFTLDDSEGQMDLLEESIKKDVGVGEIEVLNVSRQSVRIN